jgi:hypothetical protein
VVGISEKDWDRLAQEKLDAEAKRQAEEDEQHALGILPLNERLPEHDDYTGVIYRMKWRYRGGRHYELSNHLGNVQVVVTDKKIAHSSGGVDWAYYTADVLSAHDQYAFGQDMEERSFERAPEKGYRYGMNGQEKDDDVASGVFSAQYWEYDSRIGRRWNVDPVVKSWESGYSCFADNPIYFIDPEGLDPDRPISNPKNGEKSGSFTYDGELKVWVAPVVNIKSDRPKNKAKEQSKQGRLNGDNFSILSTAVGIGGLLLDSYKENIYKGDYNYKTTSGVVQSVFDTKYGQQMMRRYGEAKDFFGQGKGVSKELGNVLNYSKNAQSAIKITSAIRITTKALYVAGIVLDGLQVINAYNTNDPNRHLLLIKSSTNTVIATYGLLVPGVGWVISGTYFLIDSTIGWDNASMIMGKTDMENFKITGEHILRERKF